jgi:hypothetical protein
MFLTLIGGPIFINGGLLLIWISNFINEVFPVYRDSNSFIKVVKGDSFSGILISNLLQGLFDFLTGDISSF